MYYVFAPFTVQGRIMLQSTWRLNIGWDDYFLDRSQWIDLFKVIKNMPTVVHILSPPPAAPVCQQCVYAERYELRSSCY